MMKIINPHEIYNEIENNKVNEGNNNSNNKNINVNSDNKSEINVNIRFNQRSSIKNKILQAESHNISNNNNNRTFYKIHKGDDRYSSLRKLPSSHSTSLYLKGIKRSANNSFNSSIVNSSNISNSGTSSNTRHSNEIVKEFY